MPDIPAIQKALRAQKLDAWLFYDFRHRDPIAASVLGLAGGSISTRRWFYLIPARGTPRKLVHKIESGALGAGARTISVVMGSAAIECYEGRYHTLSKSDLGATLWVLRSGVLP
jgi:hypothetical protein